jgi:Flp pilus assembly CpaE family ATPase
MGLVAFGGLRGAPGTTSLALAVAHHLDSSERRALFVEADPDGGTVAARHGVSINPGLTELAGAARVGLASSEIDRFAQPMPSGLSIIAASPISDRVSAALRTSGTHLANAFQGLSMHRDVVVDLGRMRLGDPTQPLISVADCVVMVCHPVAEELVPLLNRLAGAPPERFIVVIVGEHPYANAEVTQATGITTVVNVPFDQRAVRSDPSAAHRRGAWPAAVKSLTQTIAGRFSELSLAHHQPVGSELIATRAGS